MAQRWDASSFLLGAAASICSLVLVRKIDDMRKTRRQKALMAERTRSINETINGDKSPNDLKIMDAPDLDLRLIRKAEAVIRWRSADLVIVVERCTNDHNYSAILRTAEALGIQHVYIIDPPPMTDGSGFVKNADGTNVDAPGKPARKLTAEELDQRAKHRLFAQNATEWITLHEFTNTTDCLRALKKENFQIWATDLSQEAVPLEEPDLSAINQWPLPQKLAIVFGTEAVGCSKEMLEKSDLRVYLPLRGYADSLNLSVATALIVHHLFLLKPQFIGSMSENGRNELRKNWFSKLACQRLLTSSEKKKRKKLQLVISNSEKLEARMTAGEALDTSQIEKVSRLGQLRSDLSQLEQASNISKGKESIIAQAVADLVECPPEPLSDLRRADPHRITFAGKNTKQKHADHWQGMAATENARSLDNSTSGYFRSKVRSIQSSKG